MTVDRRMAAGLMPAAFISAERMDLSAGVKLFNEQKFWHAHEAWECDWLATTGEEKRFLQGLIQLAAAYHLAGRGKTRGALRLFDAALEKLAPYGDGYCRVDREAAVAAAVSHREKLSRGELIAPEELPKLRYN